MNIRSGLAAAGVLALLGTSGATLAQGGGGFAPPELAAVKVRDNIYMIRSAASGNSTVLLSDDAALLIDNKLANEYDGVIEQLRKVTDLPVRYVINTHSHPDHTGGNIGLQKLGATIIAQDNTRKNLARVQDMGLPVITFPDHMSVYFGDMELELYYFGRGHTDGDIVILMPQENLLIAGDLFAGWGPSIRLIDYNSGASLKEWAGTLDRVLALDWDTVIPGHSGVTDRAMMIGYRDEGERIVAMTRELNRAGRSTDDIQKALVNEFGRLSVVVLPNFQSLIDDVK